MITVIFAPPRTGKSTLAARFAFWEHVKKKVGLNKYDRVMCNFPLKHTYLFTKDDIGIWDLTGGLSKEHKKTLCIFDEGALDFDNRSYKSFPKHIGDHLRLHGHLHEDWVFFSQSFDLDKTIRNLAPELRYLKKCTFLPNHIKSLRIVKYMQVNEETHDLVDGFQFDPWYARIFTTKRYYLPFYWGLFDSWDAPDLPQKDFKRFD